MPLWFKHGPTMGCCGWRVRPEAVEEAYPPPPRNAPLDEEGLIVWEAVVRLLRDPDGPMEPMMPIPAVFLAPTPTRN